MSDKKKMVRFLGMLRANLWPGRRTHQPDDGGYGKDQNGLDNMEIDWAAFAALMGFGAAGEVPLDDGRSETFPGSVERLQSFRTKQAFMESPRSFEHVSGEMTVVHVVDVLEAAVNALQNIMGKVLFLRACGRDIDVEVSAVSGHVARMCAVLNGAFIADQNTNDRVAAEIGATLLNTKYYQEKAQAFLADVNRLNHLINQWRDDVVVSRVAHHINHQIANSALNIIIQQIERDPRLAVTIESTQILRRKQSIIRNSGWVTLRDVALLSADEIIIIDGIGQVTLERIIRYFQAEGLPALCLLGTTDYWFYNQYRYTADGFIKKQFLRDNRMYSDGYKWSLPKLFSADRSDSGVYLDNDGTDGVTVKRSRYE
ncbi:hypothetical protein [Acidithiobacillus sp.]